MKDRHKALMLHSFKDAMDVVDEYNEWAEEAFDQQVPVPPQAVPQVAMMLYQSRVRKELASADSMDVPEFDNKMYE